VQVKELTYMHSEGLQAGELKHGPLALVDSTCPIIMIMMRDNVFNKCMNALQQVRMFMNALQQVRMFMNALQQVRLFINALQQVRLFMKALHQVRVSMNALQQVRMLMKALQQSGCS
jgi:glucosamine 6-phosphate synthetase-like amidotransferase/phosphosugar isomerase protein